MFVSCQLPPQTHCPGTPIPYGQITQYQLLSPLFLNPSQFLKLPSKAEF